MHPDSFQSTSPSESQIPPTLYRYRPLRTIEDLERDVALLKRNFIWLSSPTEFNDPFDFLLAHTDESAADVHRIRGEVLIGCLSANPRSIPMWSHYGNCHRGICIEYPFTSHLFDKIHAPIFRVDYVKIRPGHEGLDPKQMIVATPQIIGAVIRPQEISGSNVLATKITRFKAEEWRYEEEWSYVATETMIYPDRQMAPDAAADWQLRQETEYGPHHRHLALVPKPSQIILGAKMSQVMKAMLHGLFASLEIPTIEAHPSKTEWKIEF